MSATGNHRMVQLPELQSTMPYLGLYLAPTTAGQVLLLVAYVCYDVAVS